MASVFNRGTKDRPSWWAKIKDADGEWRSAPTHQPNKEAAKRWANAKQADVENTKVGILPRASQPNALTVRSLFERFLAEYEGPKIRKTAEYRMQRRSDLKRRIVPYSLAAMPAQKVRTVDIERWRDALRKQRLSHSSIHGTLARLSTTFAWAIRNEILSGPNPCVGVQRLPTKPRQDCYTLDEVHRLLSVSDGSPPKTMPTLIAMALYTGMRRGELLGLRWEDIHFQTGLHVGRIHVGRSYEGPTKTDQPRVLPLHTELAPILLAWQKRCPKTVEGIVFPRILCGVARRATNTHADTTRTLRAELARAHVRTDFACPFHAMRHTFASLFMEQVDSQSALERILGHSTGGNKITAGYVHTDIKTLARKLNQMTLKPLADASIIPLRATA